MNFVMSILILILKNFLHFFLLTGLVPKPHTFEEDYGVLDWVFQSGEYGKSKYRGSQNRKKCKLKKNLHQVQSKKKQMSSAQAEKTQIQSAVTALEQKLKKMNFQSGELNENKVVFTEAPPLEGDPYGVDDEPLPAYWWGILSTCKMFQPVVAVTTFVRSNFLHGTRTAREMWVMHLAERRLRAPTATSWYQTCKWWFRSYSSHSVIDNIENLITLSAGLWTSTSAINATALVIAHLKIYHQASVTETLISSLMNHTVLDEDFWSVDEWENVSYLSPANRKIDVKKQRESYDLQDGDFADLMRGSIKNWKLLKHSKFVRYMIDLIAILVSSTMCSVLSLDFNVAGIPLFSESLKKRLDSMNIIDTGELVLEAASYFLDVGYLCFTQKTFKPILYTDAESFSFDQRFINYLANFSGAFDSDWETIGFTESQYIQENQELTDYYTSLHSVIAKGPEKVQIFQRMAQLAKLKMELTRRINSCGMRVAPYVILIFGSSSVGKTSVASILNTIAIKMCDGTGDPAKRVTSNENDQYFSGYSADTESVVMDDICNTNTNFLQTSPLANLIKWANNNPELALMADLDSKGKIAIRPKTILLTSNVQDLNASVFSVEPVSILRRLNVHVTVRVKEEFALLNGSGQKMMDPVKANAFVDTLTGEDKDYPDLWDITLSRVVTRPNPVSGRPDIGMFEPIWYNKKFLKDISIREAAEYIAHDSRIHKLNQVKIVDGQSTIHTRLKVCKQCARLASNCQCIEMQAGEMGEESVADRMMSDFLKFHELDVANGGTGQCAATLFCTAQHFGDPLPTAPAAEETTKWFSWLTYFNIGVLPFCAIFSLLTSHFVLFAGCFFVVAPFLSFFYRRFFWWYSMWKYGVRYRNFMLSVGSDICAQTKKLKTHLTTTREGKLYLAGTATLFSTWLIFKLIKLGFKGLRAYRVQSRLNPDDEEFEQRKKSPSAWFTSVPKSTRGGEQSATTTWENLAKMRENNHVFVKWGTKICGGFMLKTHFLLLPNHFLREDAKLTVKLKPSFGKNLHECTCNVSTIRSYHIPGTDLRVWYLPTGGDFRDMTPYLPVTFPDSALGSNFAFRDINGEIQRDVTRCNPGDINVQGIQYRGWKYTLSDLTTFRGMCMASLVSEGKHPKIIGFHLGGVPDTSHGAAGCLTASQASEAFSHFDYPGILQCAESSDLDTMQFADRRDGKSYMLQGEVRPQCPTNHLPDNASVDVIGPCIGGSTRSSQVIISHISETITEVFGVDRAHGPAPLGPPAVPKWFPWQLGMQGFSTISEGPDIALLCIASEDYLSDIMQFTRPVELLDMPSIINGIDNDRFINRMPQNTSVGFPLSGPLKNVCTLLEPVEDHACNFTMDEDILEEFERCERLLLNGVRINAIYRASLKDEMRPIGSEKARVFQAAPLVLKMLLRKYYLPIVSLLSMFPLASECAVGINAMSEEWQEMHDTIVKFGDSRIVAGDYSAYDQRMSPAITSAAFDILVRFAEHCGYSERSLIIMRSLATEVVYPYLAYDGTLIRLMGSNPSGHNLTVYINSIANSLISRCAFYSLYPPSIPFKEAVSMMTYGDDDIGSVNSAFPLYDNISKSNYITSIGMRYTPPSKSGDHVKYMMMAEVDFLKRKSVFNDEKKRFMGALELSSIFKSLHCRMRSTELDDAQWAGSVCDAALREAFPRGKEFYTDMQRKLTIVADKHAFHHHCANLDDSYEECSEKIG